MRAGGSRHGRACQRGAYYDSRGASRPSPGRNIAPLVLGRRRDGDVAHWVDHLAALFGRWAVCLSLDIVYDIDLVCPN